MPLPRLVRSMLVKTLVVLALVAALAPVHADELEVEAEPVASEPVDTDSGFAQLVLHKALDLEGTEQYMSVGKQFSGACLFSGQLQLPSAVARCADIGVVPAHCLAFDLWSF